MVIENWIVLGLGGNMGDRTHHIAWAQKLIELHLGNIVKSSRIYETAAWGNNNQPHFLNQVVMVKSLFTPQMCLKRCLHIEKIMGRERDIKWGPRIIDIDILLYNNIKLQSPGLLIPHPFLQDRRFVLQPLVDILPNYQHPVLRRSLRLLLSNCTDALPVKPHPFS